MATGIQVCAALALCLCVTSMAETSSNGGVHAYDISTIAGLRDLYNSRVLRAELWERPLSGRTPLEIAEALEFKHLGVVVTTENGERWLVHKGDGYGKSSPTVVVAVEHMSSRWTMTDSKPVSSSRVADYVRAGGDTYDLVQDNSHHASSRMMALP